MTLPLPNLDDRTYADLVAEARSQISIEYPEWTDHNASDLGIILIELLSWLTELALYRVNQLPERNTFAYLNLLEGGKKQLPADLRKAIRETVPALRQRYRAVTPDDFVALVLEWNQTKDAQTLGKVKRSHCLPRRNLERSLSTPPDESAHISLIVLPDSEDPCPQPSAELRAKLHEWFAPRQLLTVRHHIVAPEYVTIQPSAKLFLEADANPTLVRERAIEEVGYFFHPLASGHYWEGKGWPFGRSVYASDLYSILDGIPDVDYVQEVKLAANPASTDETNKISIARHQLVCADLSGNPFTLMEETSNGWQPI
ncbi:MAG: hypothetical protein N4J56_006451 [Chroococcidiopsis sp. SAG 2025]|uniref:hypothetical protein n=1 Tax=Chroococcidiopsis sp. SAG 2025 TaxID=171389 RepID=UPI002936DE47|nr:hypothetical protein [Chroococcidiopsis sp. SAG 2025]MDV2996746.1 hypothetical protein [Chroococcidiopsis sp. SAG 2025]